MIALVNGVNAIDGQPAGWKRTAEGRYILVRDVLYGEHKRSGSSRVGFHSEAQTSANDRKLGGPQLNAQDRSNLGIGGARRDRRVWANLDPNDAVRVGAERAGRNRTDKCEREILEALNADPALWRHGWRTLLSATFHRRPNRSPEWEVQCRCGRKQLVCARDWVKRFIGRACQSCRRAEIAERAQPTAEPLDRAG